MRELLLGRGGGSSPGLRQDAMSILMDIVAEIGRRIVGLVDLTNNRPSGHKKVMLILSAIEEMVIGIVDSLEHGGGT
jgi:hypothetical protein